MDTVKMGKFLKELRKEQDMTQEALGERIGVTNKTVSRWETGAYVPPVECLMLMSDMYGVTINEMVAGQRLTEKEYAETADENLTVLLKENEERKDRSEELTIGIMFLAAIFTIVILFLLPGGNSTGERISLMVIAVLVTALDLIATTLSITTLALKEKTKKRPR